MIEVTPELLDRLVKAQAKYTSELLVDPYNRMGDDWGDDTNAALNLMRILFDMVWDQEAVEDLNVWLNTPYDPDAYWIELPTLGKVEPLGNAGGCDGYAPELYDLNCPALPKEN